MELQRLAPSNGRIRARFAVLTAAWLLVSSMAAAQGLTGALVGTVKDEQNTVVPGARARVASSALFGGPITMTTNERGQLRFPVLPPGTYVLDIELQGFAPYHEANIRIGAGATLERTAALRLAGCCRPLPVLVARKGNKRARGAVRFPSKTSDR